MKKIALLLIIGLLVLTACSGPRQKLSPKANVALKTANVYYAQKDVDKAEVYYLEVLEDNPEHVLALTRMGDIKLFRGENPSERQVEFNEAAYDYYKRAIVKYESFEDLEDDDYIEIRNLNRRKEAAWTRVFKAGENLQIAGNSREALLTFEKSAALDSTRFEPLVKMKEIYLNEFDDKVKAEQLLVRLQRIRPNDTLIMAELASFYYNTEKYSEALALFNRIRTQNPRDVNNLLNISSCHVEMGDLEAAMLVTREILDFEPNNVDALTNAQAIAGRMGNTQNRIDYLKRLLMIRDNTEDYTTICSLLSQNNQYVDLITYAEKWYNYDNTSRYAVQFVILGAQNTANTALQQRYTDILRGME